MGLPIERHLLRARDFADHRFEEPIGVADMAAAAGLSQAHFSRAFREMFGISPHGYLLTRRLERAAALLRHTDHDVARVCVEVGLTSVGASRPVSSGCTGGRRPNTAPSSRKRHGSRSQGASYAARAAPNCARFEKTRPAPPP